MRSQTTGIDYLRIQGEKKEKNKKRTSFEIRFLLQAMKISVAHRVVIQPHILDHFNIAILNTAFIDG